MDIFDVKRRDNPSLDRHMDPKKPPFGGPNENEPFAKNKRKSLDKYQRVVTRNADFEGGKENTNYDTTWKAITRDRASRDANKKPAEVMYAKPTIFTKAVEEGKIFRFEEFVKINEEFEQEQDQDLNLQNQNPNEAEEPIDNEDPVDLGYEVDEEQLEQVMNDYGDDLNELIDKLCEEMELEKEAVSDLLCAAIEKICKPEDDDENPDAEGTGEGDNTEPPVDETEGQNMFA
jgi:hypothetical protein